MMTNDEEDEKTDEQRDFKARAWVLTIFEQPKGVDKPRTESDIADILDPLPWAGQLEAGHETHHRHWQIYVQAHNAVHFSALQKRCPDMHIEKRSGTAKEAFDYCTKQDTRVLGPFYHDLTAKDCPDDRSGQRTDLADIADAIRSGQSVDELLTNADMGPRLAHCMTWAKALERAYREAAYAKYRTEDRAVDVRYIWGEPGIGKTFSIKTQDGVYEPSTDGKWDDYNYEDTVLFDEFAGQIPLGQMNRWLEGYRNTRLPARYHDKLACYTHVVIISNDPPEVFYRGAKSWLRRLKSVEHADWYSVRNIDFAKGESASDWDDVFNFVA